MMEVILDGVGAVESNVISLKVDHEAFKVSIIVIPSLDYDGKWSVEYSPNGTDWLRHEEMGLKTGNLAGNIFFQVPFIKFAVQDGTKGKVKFNVFGSLI